MNRTAFTDLVGEVYPVALAGIGGGRLRLPGMVVAQLGRGAPVEVGR